MQQGRVYKNKVYAGLLQRNDKVGYSFVYDKEYLASNDAKAISVNIKLQNEKFESRYLFSFFANMLSEGDMKDMQCKQLRLDLDDDFSRLLKTTKDNTIGSITIEEVI